MLLEALQLSEDEFLTRLVLEGEGYITADHSRQVIEKRAAMARQGRPVPYGDLAVAMGFVLSADHSYARYLLMQLRATAFNGRRPLGYFILEHRCARPTQLLEALEWQTQLGGRIGEIMVQNGWLTDTQLDACLALQQAEVQALGA